MRAPGWGAEGRRSGPAGASSSPDPRAGGRSRSTPRIRLSADSLASASGAPAWRDESPDRGGPVLLSGRTPPRPSLPLPLVHLGLVRLGTEQDERVSGDTLPLQHPL